MKLKKTKQTKCKSLEECSQRNKNDKKKYDLLAMTKYRSPDSSNSSS